MHSGNRTEKLDTLQVSTIRGSATPRPSTRFASSCGPHVLQFSAIRDLHNVKSVSKALKSLSNNEAARRNSIKYTTGYSSFGVKSKEGENSHPSILSINIFKRMGQRRLTIQLTTQNGFSTDLPIKDVTHGSPFGYPFEYAISENDFNITNIATCEDRVRIDFLDRKCVVLFNTNFDEADKYIPNAQQQELINAVKENKIEKASSLLITGVSADTRDQEGVPLLVRAAGAGQKDMVALLVNHHASLEARSPLRGRCTALLSAASIIAPSFYGKHNVSKKHEETVSFLVENKADINVQTTAGNTILNILLRYPCDFSHLIKYLLTKNADPTIVNLYNMRPTDQSSSVGESKNFHPLYAHCMQIDAKPYVQLCSYDASRYNVLFRTDAWTTEITYAWEAIVNKLKSLKANDPNLKYPDDALGLASDQYSLLFTSEDTADYFLSEKAVYVKEEKGQLTYVVKNDGGQIYRGTITAADLKEKAIPLPLTDNQLQKLGAEILNITTSRSHTPKGTHAYFEDRGGQIADVPVPRCSDYAINSIMYSKAKRSIEIEIKREYLNNPNVHRTIREALASLELRFEEKAVISLEKNSGSVSVGGMFGATVNSSTIVASNTTPTVSAAAPLNNYLKRNRHTLLAASGYDQQTNNDATSGSASKKHKAG